MAAEPADVLIIGAGASGGVVALRLAEAGFGVICLEQGDWHDRAEYRGAELDWELTTRKQWSTSPNIRGLPEDYPIDEADAEISPLMFTGVGGSMLHLRRRLAAHAAVRLPGPQRSTAIADDWPLSYDELRPYYERTRPPVRRVGARRRPGLPARRRGSAAAAAADRRRRAEGRPGPHPARLALVARVQLDPLGALRRPPAVRPARAPASRAATRAPRPRPT